MIETINLRDCSDTELTRWWQLTGEIPGNAASMWNSWHKPHRGHVDMALTCLPNIRSLYECGCGAGPNLRRIREYRPELLLGGSEPSGGLATFAENHLGYHIDRAALPALPPGLWDAVLFSYTLAYLSPEAVEQTFRGLHQNGTHALVLMEPTTAFEAPEGHWTRDVNDGIILVPEWIHDYRSLVARTGWHVTWCWPVLPHAELCNAVMICERAPSRVPGVAEPPVSASPLGHPAVSGTTLTPER